MWQTTLLSMLNLDSFIMNSVHHQLMDLLWNGLGYGIHLGMSKEIKIHLSSLQ